MGWQQKSKNDPYIIAEYHTVVMTLCSFYVCKRQLVFSERFNNHSSLLQCVYKCMYRYMYNVHVGIIPVLKAGHPWPGVCPIHFMFLCLYYIWVWCIESGFATNLARVLYTCMYLYTCVTAQYCVFVKVPEY